MRTVKEGTFVVAHERTRLLKLAPKHVPSHGGI